MARQQDVKAGQQQERAVCRARRAATSTSTVRGCGRPGCRRASTAARPSRPARRRWRRTAPASGAGQAAWARCGRRAGRSARRASAPPMQREQNRPAGGSVAPPCATPCDVPSTVIPGTRATMQPGPSGSCRCRNTDSGALASEQRGRRRRADHDRAPCEPAVRAGGRGAAGGDRLHRQRGTVRSAAGRAATTARRSRPCASGVGGDQQQRVADASSRGSWPRPARGSADAPLPRRCHRHLRPSVGRCRWLYHL